jgi:dethiobiotin synthetase
MPDNPPLFITGIGTGIGKTIISAVLVEKLAADYWKPVQSGDLDKSDTLMVQSLVSNTKSVFHPETYRLTRPHSPHKSAAIDGIEITSNNFNIPQTENQLIIEGAGGLMVPLNGQFLMIDLIKQLGAAVVLVSQNYLGSINHTLLSINALRQYQIPLKGIIFNGAEDKDSESYILAWSKLNLIGCIPLFTAINKKTIMEAGNYIAI